MRPDWRIGLANGIFPRRHRGGNARVLRNSGNVCLSVAVRSFGVAPWWRPEIQIPVVHGSAGECPSPATNESAHHNADRTTDQSHCSTGGSAARGPTFRPIRLSCPASTK